jgi:hypothetical protein
MWLDRFERVDGQLKVVGISTSGNANLLHPEQMHTSKLGSGTYSAVRLDIPFSDWMRASPREYARIFGIEMGVTDGHQVYSLSHEGLEIIVPVWELQRSLLRTSAAGLMDYVYRPNGLEHLCTPLCDAEAFSVAITSPLDGRPATLDTLAEKLTWFYAYPSAYSTWNSIYRHACSGRIGLDLPKASIQMSVHGRMADGVLYARRLHVYQLTPLEQPCDWAKTAPKTYRFESGRMQNNNSRQTRDPRLRSIGNQWILTDAEWETVENIAFPWRLKNGYGRNRLDDGRNVVNNIIVKLGTGMSWAELNGLKAGHDSCIRLYYKMKADGRWDKLIEFLAGSRRHS